MNAILGLGRPLALGLMLLIGLGLLNVKPEAGRTGTDGFTCHGFTDDAALNRRLCQYHPARIWNMPITELLPWLAPGSSAE